ncbi:DUF4870 domain-containing protein [Arthrobacter sp. NEB 688]|uniref:DUF4870 domain-containing protein n=1 Tax=Arthrobacter sp. NEB 688 TaxID=904039 RepID=UPI001564E30F|nr:DUF4870 domain-containing protein [Arthrobacter sp. NEB 688]QKE85207.1 DUF4870 domain-containing protein [Arthrobacter sp. NEB 688]
MSENTPRDDVPGDEPTQIVPPPPAGPPAPPAAPAPTPGWQTPAAGEVPPPPPQPAYAQQQYAQGQPAHGQQYGGSAPLSPQEEKTWSMLSHVIGLAAMVLSAGFLGFVGSLVIYLVYKDRGPFVRAHASNSLNVQITAAIAAVVGWLLILTLIGAIIGIPLLIAAFLYAVIVHIMGAIKANNGEWWDPPFTPRFVK